MSVKKTMIVRTEASVSPCQQLIPKDSVSVLQDTLDLSVNNVSSRKKLTKEKKKENKGKTKQQQQQPQQNLDNLLNFKHTVTTQIIL